MEITRFETIPIQGRAMVLKMFTDAGIIGYGEPMNSNIGASLRKPWTTWQNTLLAKTHSRLRTTGKRCTDQVIAFYPDPGP